MTEINQSPPHASRRAVLGGALAAGAAGLGAPALAQGRRTVRLAASWPAGLGGLGDSVGRVADSITRLSGGRLDVQVYWPGQLVGALAVHDAAGSGEIEMYHSAEYYFGGKHRGFNFFTTVPLGLTMLEQASWIEHGGGQALWDELNARFGVKSLACGGTGVQMGGWFDKPIESVEDLKGLTMRIPGLGGQVMQELGAETVALPGGAIVGALFDGSIDATEWVGPWNDLHFGFQKLLSTYVYPGFHEPGTMASLGMNLGFWNSLSAEERLIIETAAAAENTLHSSAYYGNNAMALTQLLLEDGVKPTRLPDEVWNAISRKAFDVVASVAEDDELGARIYRSFEAHRTLMVGAAPASQAEYLSRRGMSDLFAL